MKLLSYLLPTCLIFLALIGCGPKQTLPHGEGFMQLSDCKVWYRVPTLFTTGEFDEATPETVGYYQSLVPNSQLQVISGSGHITMHDYPDENNKVITDFLKNLESD